MLLRLAGALAVTLVVMAAANPHPGAAPLWPDAVEHLEIGYWWSQGAGFVDPIQYIHLPGNDPVVPAYAIRAPVVPFLLGLVFSSGATLLTVLHAYTLWTCAMIGVLVFVASGFMRLPIACGVGLWIGLMPSWILLGQMPMTETSAVGLLALTLGSMRFVGASHSSAVLGGLLGVLIAATRLQFAALPLAVVVALALDRESRRRLFAGPVFTYVATFGVGLFVAYQAALLHSGRAPYAKYAALTEQVVLKGVEKSSLGPSFASNAAQFSDALSASHLFSHVGWLAVPAVLWCLWGGLRANPERRFCALAALGFSVLAVVTLGAWSPQRFPLPVAVTAALCAGVLLDDATTLVARSLGSYANLRRVSWIPAFAALVLLAFAGRSPARLLDVEPWFPAPSTPSFPLDERGQSMQALCHEIPRDVLVMAHDPWGLTLWCGNPAIRVPREFENHEVRRTFYIDRRIKQFVANRRIPSELWRGKAPMRPVQTKGQYDLFKIIGVPRARAVVDAPPPLVCAGYPPECARAFRR